MVLLTAKALSQQIVDMYFRSLTLPLFDNLAMRICPDSTGSGYDAQFVPSIQSFSILGIIH